MEMLILNEEQVKELDSINQANSGLNRAVRPVKIEDDQYGINVDILEDQKTWANWVEFLADKPRKEVEISEDD